MRSHCFFSLLHSYILAVNLLHPFGVAPQPNKEWKPKASVKPSAKGPGVIGSPAKTVSPPADNSEGTKKEAAVLQDNISQLNLSENQNVIIAPHIRVSETDRCRLTFGSLGADFDTSANSVGVTTNSVEEISSNPSGRLFSFINSSYVNSCDLSYYLYSFLFSIISETGFGIKMTKPCNFVVSRPLPLKLQEMNLLVANSWR